MASKKTETTPETPTTSDLEEALQKGLAEYEQAQAKAEAIVKQAKDKLSGILEPHQGKVIKFQGLPYYVVKNSEAKGGGYSIRCALPAKVQKAMAENA